jgi:hypothetical protein
MIAGEPNAQKAIDLLATRFGLVWFTERFDEGLVMLRRWLGRADFRAEYRRENQLRRKKRPHDVAREKVDLSYLESDCVRARIQEINDEDLKVYDFVAKSIYPQQLKRFGDAIDRETQQFQNQNASATISRESPMSHLMRNYVYKPLLHCHAI